MSGSDGYRSRIFHRYFDTLSEELGLHGPESPGILDPDFRVNYLPLMPVDPDCRILDIGCGRGMILDFLKRSGYRDCRGIDFSPQMVELARGRGVDAELAEAAAYLRAHPNSFDCILALDVLEHMFKGELLDFMDAVFGALRPGGCFIAHTVNADGFMWGRMRYIDITHELAFTRYSLGQLFLVAGFSGRQFLPVVPAGSGARIYLRKLILKGMRLAVGIAHHAETGSGILNNDYIVTSSLIAKATKASA